MDVNSINRNQDYLKNYARNAEVTQYTGYISNEENLSKNSMVQKSSTEEEVFANQNKNEKENFNVSSSNINFHSFNSCYFCLYMVFLSTRRTRMLKRQIARLSVMRP